MTLVLASSALVAIVLGDREAEALVSLLLGREGRVVVAAPTVLETGIVVEARVGPAGLDDLAALLAELEVDVVAFDEEHAQEAQLAWRRFGKGRHPAALNYGDCQSYALTIVEDAELLFVGQDFHQTDIRAAYQSLGS